MKNSKLFTVLVLGAAAWFMFDKKNTALAAATPLIGTYNSGGSTITNGNNYMTGQTYAYKGVSYQANINGGSAMVLLKDLTGQQPNSWIPVTLLDSFLYPAGQWGKA